MKISIIGSGAMGSLFGGKLAQAGEKVILYDVYKEHVNAVNREGLSIEDAGTGDITVVHPEASAEPESVAESDVLIIFVKSTTTEEVAAQFKAFARPHTIVLTLQNGLGNDEILRRHFGSERTAVGVTSQGATFLGPGKIRHAGKGPTHISMADGREEKLAALAEALSRAGFETHISAEVTSLVWSKLIINIGINALTALLNVKNGRLLEFEDVKAIMADLVNEALAVASRKNIRLIYDDPLATVYDVAMKTASNTSSMLQDFQRNRQTEIDFINGAIVKEAKKLGMPVPVNETITRLVRTLDTLHSQKGDQQ
ncbi:MAG: ketopantoate reductase family protein [Rectinema subterraneum]|uniref:ketopantoate reductase family protein n=1 Tax=Rectinema subterraneum TaxID=2653714 RepID=UPI003C7A1F2F